MTTGRVDTGWGYDPLPAMSPETSPTAPPPRTSSRWVGDTLGSTAMVSAAVSWFLVGFGALAAYATFWIARTFGVYGPIPVGRLLAWLFVLAIVIPVAVAGGAVALATFAASIPLAVAWLRQPGRPAWPGYVLVAGALPWTVLVSAVVMLLLA